MKVGNIMNMETLANHIIAVAQKNEKSIDRYKLQKVMYFVLKTAKENELLTQKELDDVYNEPFLLYLYGPSLISQLERFEVFRGAPIIGSEFDINPELNKLNPIILKYLEKPLINLVMESRETPFWKNNSKYVTGFKSNIPYQLKDL